MCLYVGVLPDLKTINMENFRNGLNKIWEDGKLDNNSFFEAICELHSKFHEPLKQAQTLPSKQRELLNWLAEEDYLDNYKDDLDEIIVEFDNREI